jgi:hypothetical protein
VVAIVVHGLYDFSVFSSVTTTNPDDAGNASPALFLLSLVLLVVMIIGHKRAEVPRTKLEPIHPPAGTG